MIGVKKVLLLTCCELLRNSATQLAPGMGLIQSQTVAWVQVAWATQKPCSNVQQEETFVSVSSHLEAPALQQADKSQQAVMPTVEQKEAVWNTGFFFVSRIVYQFLPLTLTYTKSYQVQRNERRK